MQWGFDGRPTWYAPRLGELWWAFGIAVAGRTVIFLLATYTPEKTNGVPYGIIIFSITIAAVHIAHLSAVTRWTSQQ